MFVLAQVEAWMENLDTLGCIGILAVLLLVITPSMNRARLKHSLELRKMELEAAALRSKDEASRAYKVAALLVYHKSGQQLPPDDE